MLSLTQLGKIDLWPRNKNKTQKKITFTFKRTFSQKSIAILRLLCFEYAFDLSKQKTKSEANAIVLFAEFHGSQLQTSPCDAFAFSFRFSFVVCANR